MEEFKRIINPILFLIIIICFFLPFFNLTCQQQKIASVTGFDLISGTTISTNSINKEMKGLSIPEINKGIKTEEVSPEPLALIAFLLAVIGMILSFFGNISEIGASIAGLLGILVLIFLSSFISDDILGKVQYQPLAVECATGFYLALIFFITALIYNAYLFYLRYKSIPANMPTLDERMIICPTCGTVNDQVSLYCNKCGGSMEIFHQGN
jgi:hypothetical protein